MITYNDLEKLYHHKIGKNKDFNEYIHTLLKDHFEEENIISIMFDLRNEKNDFISDEEVRLSVKNEEICEKILSISSKSDMSKVKNLLFEYYQNNDELNEIYAEHYYMLGIKDAKSFKKFSLKK